MKKHALPIIAIILAVAITTTMDFTGYFQFSALPLFGLTIIFWMINRLNKKEIGLTLGKPKDYGLALMYPLVVLGVTALIAYLAGDFSTSETDWSRSLTNIAAGSTIGVLMGMLTEEGFFRGWMWGTFQKTGLTIKQTLLLTSILFTIWHISAVTSPTEYGLPGHQIPVYLINATFLGLIWGLLRLISGSIVVASVSHAVWNTLAYELFAFGEGVGALGITNTVLLGPEVGYLGILLNGAFFYWLWAKARKEGMFTSLP